MRSLPEFRVPGQSSCAQPDSTVPASVGHAITIEVEDFLPVAPLRGARWREIVIGDGNDMVDLVGWSHISSEHLLHAPASVMGAVARAVISIPAGGTYRVCRRGEQPANADDRFRVEIRQNEQLLGAAVMSEKDALKRIFTPRSL